MERDEVKHMLRDPYLAGFAASAEGHNGEYPFDGEVAADPEMQKEAADYAEATFPAKAQ
jgi:hypothetical protein